MIHRRRRQSPKKKRQSRSDPSAPRLKIHNIVLVLSIGLCIYSIHHYLNSRPLDLPAQDTGRKSSEKAVAVKTYTADEPLKITILVRNACGISQLAFKTSRLLQKASTEAIIFDVVQTESHPVAIPIGDYYFSQTLVIDRSGEYDKAERVAGQIGTTNVIQQINPDTQIDVEVVVGRDYASLPLFQNDPGIP